MRQIPERREGIYAGERGAAWRRRQEKGIPVKHLGGQIVRGAKWGSLVKEGTSLRLQEFGSVEGKRFDLDAGEKIYSVGRSG
jgi:hypothetical protein